MNNIRKLPGGFSQKYNLAVLVQLLLFFVLRIFLSFLAEFSIQECQDFSDFDKKFPEIARRNHTKKKNLAGFAYRIQFGSSLVAFTHYIETKICILSFGNVQHVTGASLDISRDSIVM